jgi:Uma2 family endonuclease
MSIVSTTKMTAKQFLELGEDPIGIRLELVDGEVAVSPSHNPCHSYADQMLTSILGNHIFPKKLGRLYGDVGTLFGEYNVRRSDLIYFAKDRLHLIGKQAMEGPPDLCVEILSPSSLQIDRQDKFKQYAKGKVANYWIINPMDRTMEGYRLVGKAYRASGKGKDDDVVSLPPFVGLKIRLGDLWQPDLNNG